MTCRDRTNEFLSAVKSIQARQNNSVVPSRSAVNKNRLQQRTEFTVKAKHIGCDLANTFAKLEKLTLLAKRKSLFDDKPTEIQDLTFIIKQDITSLNKKIGELQEIARGQKYHNGRHQQTHSSSVVVALQSRLATMSNEFKTVLEVRTENLKQQKTRREQFSQSAVFPLTIMSGEGSMLLNDEEADRTKQNDISIDMNFSQHRQQQDQIQLIDEQDAYVQNRAETMQNIESTIVELGTVFQRLATMVKEQEEMVNRIDSNVDSAELNIEMAHGEILKYFQSVSSNRWLMFKIFCVLIVFFLIFVIFLA
ncbi:syntaxin-5-like [Argonauta hians]